MSQVLVFGDSIAFGFWDREGGWVDRLKRFLAASSIDSNFDNYCPVYNLGIPGDTSEDLLERFKFELCQRKNDFEKYVIIFSIGGNDSQKILSQNRHKVTKEKFADNLKELINLAKKYTEKIILIGLTPVDESRSDPLFWIPDRSYKNEYMQIYDEIIQKISLEEGVFYINLFDKLYGDHYSGLLEDGLHPTSEGHKRIFEIIKDYLKEKEIT